MDKKIEDRVTRNVALSIAIGDKFNSLGMSRPPKGIGVDLSDIYIVLEEYKELIDSLLVTDANDHETIGDILVAIEVKVLNHIRWHSRSVKRPLERAIQYCLPDDNSA